MDVSGKTFANLGGILSSAYAFNTWLPIITFGGAAAGQVYPAQGATYNGIWRQIGDTIYYSYLIVLTTKGGSVGNALITGLPGSADGFGQHFPQFYSGMAGIGSLIGRMIGSGPGPQAVLYNQGAANCTQLADTNFADGCSIRGCGWYQVTPA